MFRPVHGGNLDWAAQLAACNPSELLDFSASISPLGPPPSVMEAVQAAFSSVVDYPDPDYGALRSQLAHHHNIPTDYILPGNGAAELLTWAARDLAERCDRTHLLSPGFSDYDRALNAFSVERTAIELFDADKWNIDHWEQALSALPQPNQRHGLLLNNPHNPTGAVFSQQRVRSLLSKFSLVVVDEAFMDFLSPEQDQSVIDLVSEFSNLVVLRSLTKFYSMPGIRLGYAVAEPNTLKRWKSWRDAWPVNSFAAAAGVAALKDTAFQQQTWQWLKAENAFLFQALSAFEQLSPLPGCANFFLVDCSVSATALQEQLLKRHKIYIRDCMSFATLGDHFFRVALKAREDNQRLLDALANVLPKIEPVSHGS
ncbi:MAG: threonine-phosphate decarboxylase CobD [Cyanobacteria bacterium J06629_19]